MLNPITKCDLRRSASRFEKAIFTFPDLKEEDLRERLRDVIGEALPYFNIEDPMLVGDGDEALFPIEALTKGKALFIGEDMNVRDVFDRYNAREDRFDLKDREIFGGIMIFRTGGDPLRNRYMIDLSRQVKTPLLEKALIRDQINSVLLQADKENRLDFYWEGNDVSLSLETEVLLTRLIKMKGTFKSFTELMETTFLQNEFLETWMHPEAEDFPEHWAHLAYVKDVGIRVLHKRVEPDPDKAPVFEFILDLRHYTGTWDMLISSLTKLNGCATDLKMSWIVLEQKDMEEVGADLHRSSQVAPDEDPSETTAEDRADRVSFSAASVPRMKNILRDVFPHENDPVLTPLYRSPESSVQTGSKAEFPKDTLYPGVFVNVFPQGDRTGAIIDWMNCPEDKRDALLEGIRKLRNWHWSEENPLSFYKKGEVFSFFWKDGEKEKVDEEGEDEDAFVPTDLVDALGQVSFTATRYQMLEILEQAFPKNRLHGTTVSIFGPGWESDFSVPFYGLILDEDDEGLAHVGIEREPGSPNIVYSVAVDFTVTKSGDLRAEYGTRLLEACMDKCLPVTLSQR